MRTYNVAGSHQAVVPYLSNPDSSSNGSTCVPGACCVAVCHLSTDVMLPAAGPGPKAAGTPAAAATAKTAAAAAGADLEAKRQKPVIVILGTAGRTSASHHSR
jgi:hypothetical protein